MHLFWCYVSATETLFCEERQSMHHTFCQRLLLQHYQGERDICWTYHCKRSKIFQTDFMSHIKTTVMKTERCTVDVNAQKDF